jgi:hypothetical protein
VQQPTRRMQLPWQSGLGLVACLGLGHTRFHLRKCVCDRDKANKRQARAWQEASSVHCLGTVQNCKASLY